MDQAMAETSLELAVDHIGNSVTVCGGSWQLVGALVCEILGELVVFVEATTEIGDSMIVLDVGIVEVNHVQRVGMAGSFAKGRLGRCASESSKIKLTQRSDMRRSDRSHQRASPTPWYWR